MTVLAITCDNCGAKYKLPESFTGNQAKCQKCGSVIDVARQRAAAAGPAATAAAPAAAKPAAAARPAIDRSKEAPKPAERPAAPKHGGERAARRGKDDGDAGDKAGEGKGRRGRPDREAKKGSPMPLIAAGVGLVAIAVVVVFLMQGGDKTKTDTAKTDTPAPNAAPQQPAADAAPKAEAPKAEAPKAETPKVETPKVEAPKQEAPKAAPEKPATPPAEAPKPADAAPTEASTPSDPTAPKKPWERMAQAPTSMEGVADPKNYGEVQWPAGFDEAKKKELQELAQEAANDTGIRGIRATKKLVEAGYGGLYALVEQLRLLDYKSPEGNSTGFALNKALEELTGGQNMRFATVEASETVTHLKAEWNTRTVRAWLQVCASYPDEAAFTKARAERLKKAAGEAK